VIDSVTRAQVIARAGNCCEYCQLSQDQYETTFHVDHVAASQHAPDDSFSNLAWTCPRCNRKKGSNLAGIDPVTHAVVLLFHPRKDSWYEHFRWNGPVLVALTPTGRATLAVLDLNSGDRVRLRESLIAEGVFPPSLHVR
jgi:hypothetical protein